MTPSDGMARGGPAPVARRTSGRARRVTHGRRPARASRSSTTRTSTHDVEIKPTWRGWIHAGTFPVAIAAGIVLIVLAAGRARRSGPRRSSWRTRCCCSATRRCTTASTGSPKTKAILKRIDHANIFLLIAGTYTPIAVLALPPDKGSLLLVARLGRRAPRHPASASSGSTRRAGCTSRSTCCSAGRPSCTSSTCSQANVGDDDRS